MHTIKELISIREEELMYNGYSLDFTMYCKRIWKQYLEFSTRYGIDTIDYKIENEFLNEVYDITLEEYKGKLQKHPLNVINLLNDFENFNSNKKLKSKTNIEIDKSFENDIVKYLEYCKNVLNNSETTIRNKEVGLKIFLEFLVQNNIFNLNEINQNIVLDYTNSYKDKIVSRKIFLNYTLRNFLEYLFLENIINYNYSFLIPHIKRSKKQLPKSFVKEDVISVLEYLKNNRSNSIVGYRNYAIILIAAKTGLRKIDIINLKYNNINWEHNEINLIQKKTTKSIKLPLTSDVGEAIIDYINNERPFKLTSDNDYIFIKTQTPLEKLSNSFSFHTTILNAMIECQIDYKKYKNIGLHSFRFTLATEALKNEIPITIISSVLGHSNINSTNTYLKIDKEKLSKCFVEVEYGLK